MTTVALTGEQHRLPVIDPLVHELTRPEATLLLGTAYALLATYGDPGNPELAAEAPIALRSLPERLTRFLRTFQLHEPAGAVVVRGIPIDDRALGPTPQRFDPPAPARLAAALDFALLLIAHAIGEPFAWSNVQGGRLVHNVLPVPGREQEKAGTSSLSTLELHTEDACHPARADYLMLFCLRNDDAVPTVYAPLSRADLDPDAAGQLHRARFHMVSEPDHVASLGESRVTSVLSGSHDRPYLAFDGFYLSAPPDDPASVAALAHLGQRLEAAATDIVLRPGDLVIIDNYRAVHGRRPFQPRYDGRDRWLKRVHVTRDLRRSRPWRPGPATAVILSGQAQP
jgi:L-asparagine oxygenase